MTLAGWLAYNLFTMSLIVLVGYLTARAGIRRSKARSDEFIRRIEEEIARTAEQARADRAAWAKRDAEYAAFIAELDAEEDGIELTVQLRKPREADAEKLPAFAAQLIRSIDQLDRDLGGEGVEFDEEATTEDATHLTLHLTFNDPDGAEERREEILRTLATLATADPQSARRSAPDADLPARIAAELDAPVPREVAALLDPVAA